MDIALKLTPSQMLTRLHRLRWCAVVLGLLILTAAHFLLALDFAFTDLLTLTLALAGWNLILGWRLRSGWAATELESFGHLAVDTLALSALLYWGGGPASAFVSLYFIPVAIAAATLTWVYAWAITLLAAGVYSLLLFNFLPATHGDPGGFTMHVVGMWASFVIGALILVIFIAGMATAVRQRDHSLAGAREQLLRNEKVTAIGALAAGAAHELSTPLSTMGMVVSELRERDPSSPEFDTQLGVLDQQIRLCKQQIDRLLGAADEARSEQVASRPLGDWLAAVFDRWRLMRPEVRALITRQTPFVDTELRPDDNISQSLINLLNNAADASLANGARDVGVTIRCDGSELHLCIEDNGPGLSAADTARAGRLQFSTKPAGNGLGLVLSHVSLERFGAEVSLDRRVHGGTRTRVRLPLAQLQSRWA